MLRKKSTKTIYLIRHADRRAFTESDDFNAVPINEIGKKNAIQLGQSLKRRDISSIYSSPIKRCLQTADYLLKGYNQTIPVHTLEMLGEPGIYINDIKKAAPFLGESSMYDLLKKLESSPLLPGFSNIEESSAILMQYLDSLPTGNYVLISHDLIIALFASSCFSSKEYSLFLPHFLEGPHLEYSSSSISISYKALPKTTKPFNDIPL